MTSASAAGGEQAAAGDGAPISRRQALRLAAEVEVQGNVDRVARERTALYRMVLRRNVEFASPLLVDAATDAGIDLRAAVGGMVPPPWWPGSSATGAARTVHRHRLGALASSPQIAERRLRARFAYGGAVIRPTAHPRGLFVVWVAGPFLCGWVALGDAMLALGPHQESLVLPRGVPESLALAPSGPAAGACGRAFLVAGPGPDHSPGPPPAGRQAGAALPERARGSRPARSHPGRAPVTRAIGLVQGEPRRVLASLWQTPDYAHDPLRPPPGARAQDASAADQALQRRRALWGDRAAMAALADLGLADATIRRFGLGLPSSVTCGELGGTVLRPLSFPIALADGSRSDNHGFLRLPGVTEGAPHPVGWGDGPGRTLWSRAVTASSTLLVLPGVLDLWLVSQCLGDAWASVVACCPSHPGGVPAEWEGTDFWRPWSRVVLGLPPGVDADRLAERIRAAAGRPVHRVSPDGGHGWGEVVRMGASAAELLRLVDEAQELAPPPAPDAVAVRPLAGDHAADAVMIDGAFVGGMLHHSVLVERRAFEDRAGDGVAMVQRYVTRVLRSDGRLLEARVLPAPPGTPPADRVLALCDGTRIAAMPAPGRYSGWSFPSISAFVDDRAHGRPPRHRGGLAIIQDVEAHLRAAVRLPRDCDYALVATFVLATFVHRVFEAMPILLANGPRGSGKSELGQAVASLSYNGLVAGRITPSGLVRLLAESRGTVVLDDMEAVGRSRGGASDICQILKVSYKQATARKYSPGRDGRVELLDFYSPKMVTNIAGADDVLRSRMLIVRTAVLPPVGTSEVDPASVATLRDELHVWAMCAAAEIHAAYQPLSRADRRSEISAPLRAVASVIADRGVSERLEEALAERDEVPIEPLSSATAAVVAKVARQGYREVAMPHLQMELAARNVADVPSAETLGRALLAIGARTPTSPVVRRRLHGQVTRFYSLDPDYLAAVAPDAAGLVAAEAFCVGVTCQSCALADECGVAAPGLREAKAGRRA